MFNFEKLGIQSFEDLQSLPDREVRMFPNNVYTDGFTRRVSFCQRVNEASDVDGVSLELNDFNQEEIKKYFRPCTVDPNRIDVFVSFHGNTDIRRLSTAEYYNMNGNRNRQKKEEQRKTESNIKKIETDIPTPKTVSVDRYLLHILYMMEHRHSLSNFYGFNTARDKWRNYVGSQNALDSSVNILINGSKKYNNSRRRHTKSNKRKRKKMRGRGGQNRQEQEVQPNRVARNHKPQFEVGDQTKMPLVIFGDGMKIKDHVRIKGHQHGVSGKVYKQLQQRERLGELLLLDINEYNTSKTCNSCLLKNLKNLRRGSGEEEYKIHQILICERCNIFWNRDVMVAKNMFTIAESIWNGNDRPNVFQRQSATSNVVAASHSGETTA